MRPLIYISDQLLYRQPAVAVGTRFSRVSYWLLPAQAGRGRRQNPHPCFCQYSVGLLQLVVLRHSRLFDKPPAVSSERRHIQYITTGIRRCEHITPALRQLHWPCQSADEWNSRYPHRSLTGTTPVFLADECTFFTADGRCSLRSADNRTCLVKRSRN